VQITTSSIYETRYVRKTNTVWSATLDTSEKWPENGPLFAPRYFPRAYKNMRSSLANFSPPLFILTLRAFILTDEFCILVFASVNSGTRVHCRMHFRFL